MALREITREETSTWHQAGLTLSGEDREYRGSAKAAEAADEGQGGGSVSEAAEVVKDVPAGSETATADA